MDIDLEQLKNIIITACEAEIHPRFNAVERNYKTDGSVVTEADLAMQKHITEALQIAYPEIPLLGEEMSQEEQQDLLSSPAVWCLDPIDGTSNFAAGDPYFSVSLALIENGKSTVAIVYDPIRDECFMAKSGEGAWLNEQKLYAKKFNLPLKKTLAIIDYKRLPSGLATQLVTTVPYGSQRSLGSIALELCWIASGRAHVYLHAKQHLWDYAAALLILKEAGGMACTFDGELLQSNTLSPRSTIAALDKQLFDDWRSYLNVPYVQ